MRLDILRGDFLPGSRIRGSEARIRYGVSPTPFREALQRLASDGLVEIDAQSGARVARVSREDLADIFSLRQLLECEALRRSVDPRTIEDATINDGWAASVSRALDRYRDSAGALRTDLKDRGLIESWSTAHDRFFETLYSGCGSERLQQLVRAFVRHAHRYRAIAMRLLKTREFDEPQIDILFAETESIHGAVLNREAEEAVKVLEGHLKRTEAYLARVLSLLDEAENIGREPPESS